MGLAQPETALSEKETTAKLAATTFLFSAACHHAHLCVNFCPLKLLDVPAHAASLRSYDQNATPTIEQALLVPGPSGTSLKGFLSLLGCFHCNK